ncbi:MAG: helix-turn-helix transcriptional regulator [Terriglobales bacterium]|jgi:ribosome-binding protein aMBF1 (putative translation factor)
MDVTVAETTPAPAILVDTKAVIRCKKCQLNQFMTRQGNCRRCRRPLLFEELPVIVHECQPARSAQPASPARPSIDMATAIWLLRSARGMSQRDMAKKMGIARTYISKLEGNRCVPSPPQIRRIAGILEVSEYCLVTLATMHNQFASRQ